MKNNFSVMPNFRGNTMATKKRIADMHPIIQIIKIVPAKSPNQTCLR